MRRHFLALCLAVTASLLATGPVGAASGNASLETLTVRATGGATLVPAFSPERTQYEVSLPSDIQAIQVRGSAWVGASKIKVNEQPAASLAWQRIVLKPGVNKVVFNVVAPDGSTQRDYTLSVTRDDIRPVAEAFLKFTYKDPATGATMPYRLFVPAGYDASKKYPLVMFLHGGGENGTDNERQLAGSEGATIWAKPAEQARRPAFVLAPQGHPYVNPDPTAPLGGFGITRDREGNRFMTQALAPSADAQLAVKVIEQVMRDYSIDPRRIYGTGLSQGGFGTWNIALMRPDLFAAIAPIAGGGDPALAARLTHTAVWAFHAEDDQVVPVSYSRNTIAALRSAGLQPTYTELPSGTFFDPNEHWSWVFAYRSEAMREWMFRQARP